MLRVQPVIWKTRGPVLDVSGVAGAVDAAIIPEYGGSDFGIPVEYARRLMDAAGINGE